MHSRACTLLAVCTTAIGCAGEAMPSLSARRCTEVAGSHHAFTTTRCGAPVPDDPRLSCGVLALAEDPDAERSCKIEIAWVRYTPSESTDDVPVFVLGGGPGQAMVERTAEVVALAKQVAPTRSWILHDPRGVGASTPRLDCSGIAAANDDEASFWVGCARTHRDAGHDPARYRTEMLAADLDALAEALGFPQIDVFGVSYGSRLAYAHASMYPSRVRALVLDAATPLDTPLLERLVADYRQALSNVFADCAASTSCAGWHGDVATAHDDNLARFATDPPGIEFGEDQLPLSAQLYVGLTTQLAGTRASHLPAFIRAVASGDYAPVLDVLDEARAGGSEVAPFTYHGIMCSEELPQNDRARAEQDLAALPAYGSALMYDLLAEQCEAFGLAPEPGAEPAWQGRVEPLATDTPVLALNGRYDPLSVASNWSSATLSLPEGSRFEIPNAGHGARKSACGAELITRFLARPVSDLETAGPCTTPPDFFAEAWRPHIDEDR